MTQLQLSLFHVQIERACNTRRVQELTDVKIAVLDVGENQKTCPSIFNRKWDSGSLSRLENREDITFGMFSFYLLMKWEIRHNIFLQE